MGSSAIFGYLVCGLTMALVLACFADVSSRVPGSGGAYAYVEAAFGPLPAFLVGTLLWFGYAAAADAAVAHVCISSLAEFFPFLADSALRPAALVGLIAAIAVINIGGVRWGIRLAVFLTAVKLVPLLALLAAGVPAILRNPPSVLDSPALPQLGDGAVLLFFMFAGAECALTPGAEIRDPSRTIPRALRIAVASLLVLFLGLQMTAQCVLGAELAGHANPLGAAAGHLLGPAGRWLLLGGAVVSTLGTLAGDILATPRAIQAMAARGQLPARFGAVSGRFRTPAPAILLYGAVIAGFALSGAFRELAVLASASVLVIYLLVCLASLRLRWRSVEPGGIRFPRGSIVPVLATTCVSWLLAQLSIREWLSLGAFMGAALILNATRRRWLQTDCAGTGHAGRP
jgi:amino acid transporter